MSHRRSNISRQDQHTRYVPKTQQQARNPIDGSNPGRYPVSLSSSLRQLDSAVASSSGGGGRGGGGGTGSSSSEGRITMGDQGQWMSSRTPSQGGGNFVNYLPQDEAVAVGFAAEDGGSDPIESQRVVDLLNRELTRLLKLSPREFWREVASDASLHDFLDSFLQFRSRWYDFPFHGVKGIVAGVIVGELELSRRVFMILYRISSNRDPGCRAADSLSQKDHGVLLQDKKLLDLPKLLDICAIYGHENVELTKSLIENAMEAQPWIPESLNIMLSHFLGILHTMYHRCTSSLETLLSSGNSEDQGSRRLRTDLLEVMDFINDGVVSLDGYISVHKPAAFILACPVETSYGNDELLSSILRLHDSLLPSVHRGFQLLFKDGEHASLSDLTMSLKMLSTRIVNFCWKILDICYLSDEMFNQGTSIPAVTKMFPSSVEDPMIRADILMQTFREIGGVSQQMLENKNRLLQKIERNYRVMDRLVGLQNAGWISMEDEQFQYLSMITSHSSQTTSVKDQHLLSAQVANTNSKQLVDEDAVVMQSKISQIKDLFPDYGNGFLAACLEAYNQNPEEIIQRILEGTLHEDLKRLDTSLETMPQPKSASTISSQDKGKGKLVESDDIITSSVPYKEQAIIKGPSPHAASSASSASSTMTMGRFIRKAKDDAPNHAILDARNENDKAKDAALLAEYEYEDEYDDSFDDLGFSVVESAAEESEKFGLVSGSESDPSSARKWGSRKAPQFYVKDGKNYSYKVAGSVAVANANEASLVSRAQGELIHGLGHGGNIPLGAVKKLTEYQSQQDHYGQNASPGEDGRENARNSRGRGGRGGRGMGREQQDRNLDAKSSDVSETESRGGGRGRRGGGRGGRSHHHKDRAMKKHVASISGF
ncbi:PREDICTED: activating signal cointegrator 1 complex subunit 2-like [Tarenaya hassleriana]|uniref:activating signal cointegrator 1 complex subunit 2-like n=1 Tax=Tarenaya hassleriana TaxID=28532 RepID=UPI00053C241E|nr:PREDICTED: activating signal cointegrator 1 complex subunit 2-like [Tarenaya hassleriana]